MYNGDNVYVYFFMVLWILFQLYSGSPVALFFFSDVKVMYRAIYNGLSTPVLHVKARKGLDFRLFCCLTIGYR